MKKENPNKILISKFLESRFEKKSVLMRNKHKNKSFERVEKIPLEHLWEVDHF